MGTFSIEPKAAQTDETTVRDETDEITVRDTEPPAAEIFAVRVEEAKPIFSSILIGCFVAIFLCELYVGIDKSVIAAGLVKPFVREGQLWRLVTSATMHGGLLHIYLNSQALFNIGGAIEALSNRAHVAVCFLLAAIGGSVASLILMPETNSIGASGGIVGLFGFLGVFGFVHKEHLPPGFLRNIFINLALIVAVGVIGYGFIDNAAHAGGLLTGIIYGLIFARNSARQEISNLGNLVGFASLIAILLAASFAVWQMLIF
jgi:membrane associated rhomboid family serine protease